MVNHWEIALALYKEDKYSDLVVACEDQKFNLHRAVVCPQSPFFERKCENDAQVFFFLPLRLPFLHKARAKRG